jgi:hypothetical protein
MARSFRVEVSRLPAWIDWQRLLGPGRWEVHENEAGQLLAAADLTRDAAADLAARLRGVGLGGNLIEIRISPALSRKELRKAHTEEARRYRKGSPGFLKSGTRLDPEGKVSLTPETLALQLGERARGMRVIDAFAGAGGNAIGFARAGCSVTAIELDEDRLAMARHNAGVYGVADRIRFIPGDARRVIAEHEADLLFLDPPWGGCYNKERMTLDDLAPCAEVIESATRIPKVWIKAPPSFDPATLPGYRPEAWFGVGAGDDRRVKFLLLEKS